MLFLVSISAASHGFFYHRNKLSFNSRKMKTFPFAGKSLRLDLYSKAAAVLTFQTIDA